MSVPGGDIRSGRPGFVQTLKHLGSAQKPPAAGSPAYSRFVNRKFGRVLAAGAFQLGMTPNQVTAVSAAFSAAAITLLAVARPSTATGITVTVLLLVGYAFDSADGQLARLRGGGSPAGEWLDHVVDAVKTSALHLAVLIVWFRFYDIGDRVLLMIPVAFTLVGAVFFFAQILTDLLRRAHPDRRPPPAGSGMGAIMRSIVVIPTDYGLLCLSFVLLGRQTGFVLAYSLLFAGTALFLVMALPKWFREISRFGPAESGADGPSSAEAS
jgi:phosphatidylglycerophosphate synthase